MSLSEHFNKQYQEELMLTAFIEAIFIITLHAKIAELSGPVNDPDGSNAELIAELSSIPDWVFPYPQTLPYVAMMLS